MRGRGSPAERHRSDADGTTVLLMLHKTPGKAKAATRGLTQASAFRAEPPPPSGPDNLLIRGGGIATHVYRVRTLYLLGAQREVF